MTVRLHCVGCDVYWTGWDPCWCCGEPGTSPQLYGNWSGSPTAGSHGYHDACLHAVLAGQYVDIEPSESFLEMQ